VGVFLFIILILVLGAAVISPIVIISMRRDAREQKNFERGLKMVPLLIHLPPISEDTDANGRDVRELVDENISKGQVIYNIIASTYAKGLKRKLVYGQQHFAFEIVSSQGFVYFYATVPIGMVEVVRQAIVSAYPAARLEEAEEHNIFNISGKSSGTTGGELVLKESFAYPISTYQDLKRDAMQAMLNSLSTVGKEDGAAIQILMRPADPGWRKVAHGVASSKRKGDKGGNKVFGLAKEVGTAFYKPPEAKSDGGDKPQLSEHEMAVLNAIDEKTRYPAYEVLIRLVASSNVSQKSQTILNNMVAAFSLFDAPGKNGFKYEPAKDVDELVTSYVMKFFPQDKTKMVLNSVELATIFHFPDQRSIPTSQLSRQDSKQVDGPRNMPEDGLLLGYNVFRGVKKPIRLALGDRQRHMYVVGQTGTGKSTYLENLALQDMMSGNGFAFVDPHGDTAEKLLSMVPKSRTEDVIYFSPADMEYPMGLNLFEFHNTDQKDFIIQEVLNMLKKLYDPNNQGIMGPRYEDMFRNAALAVMADPAGGTFIEIPQLFRDPQFLKEKIQHVTDQTVRDFWLKQFPASQRSNEAGEVTAWFVSKFGAFLSNEMMRNIIGQTKSAFNLRDIMDNKKILLVNLSKGRTGDLNSKLLGMIFVMKFQAAAMSRADTPESMRQDFSLYVDEFQNFSTDSFATIMSEARKYRLNLIVANQFTTQLSEEIRDAVFGNMGTIVAFRIGQNDVDSLSRYFQPTFDGDDLLRVPNYNSIVRTLIGGVPTQPFSMATLPPLGEPNSKLSNALKQLSAAKYGRPKSAVEKEIFDRIRTKEPTPAPGTPNAAPGQRPFGASPWQQQSPNAPVPQGMAAAGTGFGVANRQAPVGYNPAGSAFGGQPARQMAQPPQMQPQQQRTGTGSFLDEWMAKRSTNAPVSPINPTVVTPATNPVAPYQPPQTPPVAPHQPPSSIVSPTPAANTTFAPARPAVVPAAAPVQPPRPSEAPESTEPVEPVFTAPNPFQPAPVSQASPLATIPVHLEPISTQPAETGDKPASTMSTDNKPVVIEPTEKRPVVQEELPAQDTPSRSKKRRRKSKSAHKESNSDSQSAAENSAADNTNETDDNESDDDSTAAVSSLASNPFAPKPVVFGLPQLPHNESDDSDADNDLDLSVLKNRPAKTEDQLNHGDTIYIDKDGNFKPMEDEADASKPAPESATKKQT
jgi:hypothetical protein